MKKNWLLVLTYDMKNLVNFIVSSGKFESLHFDVLLLSIAYRVSAKKIQRNYFSWHWRVIQTLKKIAFSLKNDMRNLANFNASNRKSENLHFLDYFCRKCLMFELEKCKEVVSLSRIYGFKNGIRSLVNFHTSSWT